MEIEKGIIKFSDVAHLYLGCRIQYTTDPGTEFTLAQAQETAIIKTKRGAVIFPIKYDVIKPYLFQLKDISKECAAWCLQQVFFPHAEYPLKDFRLSHVGQQKNNSRIACDNDWYDDHWCNLTFGNDNGAIWGTAESAATVKIPPTIFLKLTKDKYDLFGLIKSGQALDAKTLK